jgi:hypothetical protein
MLPGAVIRSGHGALQSGGNVLIDRSITVLGTPLVMTVS